MQQKHRQPGGRRRQCFPGTGIYDHALIVDFRPRGQAKNILKARERRAAGAGAAPSWRRAKSRSRAHGATPPLRCAAAAPQGGGTSYVTKSNNSIQGGVSLARAAPPPPRAPARPRPMKGPRFSRTLSHGNHGKTVSARPHGRPQGVECTPHPLSPSPRGAGMMRRVGHLSSI
ncbi:uncharacterized protein AruCF_1572 [Achromobacter ruhlandii]|nr:uncharacterized protein AruCF_1572 [Achromobacter ruhlandii]